MTACTRGFAAGGLVALALLAPEAHAERKSVQTVRTPVPEPDSAPQLRELLERDFELARSVLQGSPVRRRARARRRHRLSKLRNRRRRIRSFEVFRSTQKGPFDRMILRESEAWGLDPFLFKGLLINESRLDPELTGKRIYEKVRGRRRAVGGGARGIAQFTHNGVSAVNEARQRRYYRGERVEVFRQRDVWDAELSIAASAELLASYIERFGRDGGVTAYNTGPYGGRLVAKHGFYRARASGRLSRVGRIRLQGHKFLLNVLRKSNALRREAGLRPLPRPGQADRQRRRERRRQRRIERRRQRSRLGSS